MDDDRGSGTEADLPDDEGGEDHGDRPEFDGDPLRDDGAGPGGADPESEPGRTDDADPRPTWIEVLLPILVVLVLATLALLWNIVAAIVVLIIGIGVILSWVIQKYGPDEPGE